MALSFGSGFGRSITPTALILTIGAWDNIASSMSLKIDMKTPIGENCCWSIIGVFSLRSGFVLNRCDPEGRDTSSSGVQVSVLYATYVA